MLTKINCILSAVQVSEISEVIGFKDSRVQCTAEALHVDGNDEPHMKPESYYRKRFLKLNTFFAGSAVSCKTARPKSHTLSSGTSAYSPNKGVLSPGVIHHFFFRLVFVFTDFTMSVLIVIFCSFIVKQ